MNRTVDLIEKLEREHELTKSEWVEIFDRRDPSACEVLFAKARKISTDIFGNSVYIRGLIEFTNHCRNNCYYCGIRQNNTNIPRYRLSKDEIIECCSNGYDMGFRTFVLQGGEDPFYSDTLMVDIISSIKSLWPDCAVTLSIGEKSCESYRRYFEAGADRYLLRHETADPEHYSSLHPPNLSLESRIKCLWDLKKTGFQVGTGFMVGSPGQTSEHLAEDMMFINSLQPHMIGIGPFIPHHDTPFASAKSGSEELTLYCIGLLRLMLPDALIPSTTALGTISEEGREKGILAGANVVMPNLSPFAVREKYELYDNKICTGGEAAECRSELQKRLTIIGYETVVSRGDHPAVKPG